MFAVYDEKLFSGMCKWSNHCLPVHHLLPSKRDTGHNLRHRGHSYQLVSYNFSSTRRCFSVHMLFDTLLTYVILMVGLYSGT